MYKLKNGILYQNDKKVFGIGSHYYPSYHPLKVPVKESGDREGEAKRDLRLMKDAYINIVRTAAIGKVVEDGDGATVSFPMGDIIARECDKNDLALIVRLNGYDNTLKKRENSLMIDDNGEPIKDCWNYFVRNCLSNDEVTFDNKKITRFGGAHFNLYPCVVGYQIYNEPAYPNLGFFDYNEHSVKAYRKWLVNKGVTTEEESSSVIPPTRRPTYAEDKTPWINWRLFHLEKLNDYLNEIAAEAKKSGDDKEVLTCMTVCPVQQGSSIRGADYFRNAEGMDIVGITVYLSPKGPTYFEHSRVLDYAESAAASQGKHLWVVECDGKINLSPHDYEVNIYSIIGSGAKGIMPYQWRGDIVVDGAPEPDGFGMLYNDGRPTEKYQSFVKMNKLLYNCSESLVNKERLNQGVAILFSESVNAYCDAAENGDNKDSWKGRESSILNAMAVYRDLKRYFVSAYGVRTKDLTSLNIKVLFIPYSEGLSETEWSKIRAFEKNGGTVYWYNRHLSAYQTEDIRLLFIDDILAENKICPPVFTDSSCVDVKVLEDDCEYALTVVNYDERNEEKSNVKIELCLPFASKECQLVTADGIQTLSVSCADKKYVIIPRLTSGGIIFIKK